MALVEIPTNKDLGNYQFQIPIDEVVYYFSITYNYRISRYVLSILDSDQNNIINGLPVLTNVYITDNFKYLEIPKGDFFPLSVDNQNAEINDLGDKVRLCYNV